MSRFKHARTILSAMTTICVVLFLVLFVHACLVQRGGERRYTTLRVEAVFLNDEDSVSFLERTPNGLVPRQFNRYHIVFKDDLPLQDGLWARVTDIKWQLEWLNEDIVVHIHSQREVRTGGWDHGKFGSGVVHRVE